jgi:hypothetical protein
VRHVGVHRLRWPGQRRIMVGSPRLARRHGYRSQASRLAPIRVLAFLCLIPAHFECPDIA